jgi:long-chain fatty acid transport protein
MVRFRPSAKFLVYFIAPVLFLPSAIRAQGITLLGVGPINHSMGGAAVAAPIDADGALYWNPASITGLPGTEMEFGTELLYPSTRLSSTISQGALGRGVPPVTLSGSNRGDNGVFPLPEIGVVYTPDESCWTYGLGLFTVGGFSVNYPASAANPILTPQAPRGLGLGSLYADFQVIQIVPTAAYHLTDHLSLGFSPTVNLARLSASPGFLGSPDDANGDGFPTYADLTHTRYVWGLGFQLGAFYTTNAGWGFGASLKSPQWFEPIPFNATDELGRFRSVKLHIDYPLIASLGASYTGFEKFVLAGDVHFIDYKNTNGFNKSGFDPSGAVAGLGWRSIFALDLGAQYQATEKVSLRVGYSFGMNPVSDSQSTFNVQSPAIIEHGIYAGLSYNFTKALLGSVAYAHGFQNSINGPLETPRGAVPGTSVENTTSLDTLIFGATLKY